MRLFYVKVEVSGLDNIEKNKAYIVLANHQNTLIDALVILCFSKIKNLHFLARADIFNINNTVKRILTFFRINPVYRPSDGLSKFKNIDAVWANGKKILQAGHSICLFPEGTHSATYGCRPLKKGYLKLAEASHDKSIEFLPIFIHFENHFSGVSKIWVEICPPILQNTESSENVEKVFHDKLIQSDHIETVQSYFKQSAKNKIAFPTAVQQLRNKQNHDLKKSTLGTILMLAFTAPLFVVSSILFLPIDIVSVYLSRKVKDIQFALSIQLVIKWLIYSILSCIYLVSEVLMHPYWFDSIIKLIIVISLGVFHKTYLYKLNTLR